MSGDEIMVMRCQECGKEFQLKRKDFRKFPSTVTGYITYSYCNDCRGKEIMKRNKDFRLKPCPFCGQELEYIHEMHYTKYDSLVQSCFWGHPDDGVNDCILDEICMPFIVAAGDADPERGYVGEYGEKWNKRREAK